MTFEQPVCVVSPPGETNRIFVLERTGRIMVVNDLANPSKSVFLDLSPNLATNWLEFGLLGLAFHPDYANNRYFYVYRTLYTTTPGATNVWHDQLSRFETSPIDPNLGVAESEVRLFAQYDESAEHNAGSLHFGPDGYLYIALGDNGPGVEHLVNKQALDKDFFGAILRIDVDKRPDSLAPNPHPSATDNYAVPADNPFVGITQYQGIAVDPGKVRTEFWAVGFRNPWRMAFDSATGVLYAGDVGDGRLEEVNVIVRGGNYGWPYREGSIVGPYVEDSPPEFSSIPPLHEYSHGNGIEEGNAVTGGLVYRGTLIPQLQGAYVFADYVNGQIWAIRHEGPAVTERTLLSIDPGISAFGLDPSNGDILYSDFNENRIKRIVYVPPELAKPLPRRLSETGAFSDLASLVPSPGIVPYEINVPFWSDNAIKSRWFSLPDPATTIGFEARSPWSLPSGAVWIKHFELELVKGDASSRRRLETRLLVKNDQGLYGVTYRWGASATDAELVPNEGRDETFQINEGGVVRDQVWHYPSRSECLKCHTEVAGYALGFNTAQLNRLTTLGHNQLQLLSDAGYFSRPIDEVKSLPALAHATDAAQPLEFRARSYLSANCVQCHQPGGAATTLWDARITTPIEQAKIIDGSVVYFSTETNRIVLPGSTENSMMLTRIAHAGSLRMPPIATSVIDTQAVDLLTQWVMTRPRDPWTFGDIGSTVREGGSSISAQSHVVQGSGAGFGETADAFQFLHRPMRDAGEMVARVTALSGTGGRAQVAVLLRESVESNSAYVALALEDGQRLEFKWRAAAGQPVQATPITLVPSALPQWLRVVRQGNLFSGFHSLDGQRWLPVGAAIVELPDTLLAGISTTSQDPSQMATAVLDNVSLTTLRLTSPTQGETIGLPGEISLTAEVTSPDVGIAKVEFYSAGQLLGQTLAPPYELVWNNALSAEHELLAKATTTSGSQVWSEPVRVNLTLPVVSASYVAQDGETGGDWAGRYGNDGFIIVGAASNLAFHSRLWPAEPPAVVWENPASSPAALVKPGGGERIAAAWSEGPVLEFELHLLDGFLHRVGLYFLDFDTPNQRVQRVEVLAAANGALLDTRTVSSFSAGQYHRWALRGHIRFRITSESGPAPVVSGLFVDDDINVLPLVSLSSPIEGATMVLPAPVVLQANATDADGLVGRVDFFANDVMIGEALQAPFAFTWSDALAGQYKLRARATDDRGDVVFSHPVNMTLSMPAAVADFVGRDTTTSGWWRGRYGAEGYLIVEHATNSPPFAVLDVAGVPRSVVWQHTHLPQALEWVDGAHRIAATWVDDEAFYFDLALRDGRSHQLSIYFLDYDTGARVLEVEVRNASTGDILDSREVSGFSGGHYLKWNLSGNVRIEVRRNGGPTPVLSGLFLDPPGAPVQDWHRTWFTPQQLLDSSISGDEADPDGDGLKNLLEYAFNSNPLSPNPQDLPRVSLEDDHLIVSYPVSKSASGVRLWVELSADLLIWETGEQVWEEIGRTKGDATDWVNLRASRPLSQTLRGFVRWRAQRP